MIMMMIINISINNNKSQGRRKVAKVVRLNGKRYLHPG